MNNVEKASFRTPITIHSLHRSGSTYLFNSFRRSAGGYYCYQEPLNSYLLNARDNPNVLLEVWADTVRLLRHPTLDKPYFFEFRPLADKIAEHFRPSFSVENYFGTPEQDREDFKAYLNVLIQGAQGRPVLQECLSIGRVGEFKDIIGGQAIFLWRNPWDHWWSNKVNSHFEIVYIQLLSYAQNSYLGALRSHLKIGWNLSIDAAKNIRFSADQSYLIFFMFWIFAMDHARRLCDISCNIDSLAISGKYRRDFSKGLDELGITGLDFSDCATPISFYGEGERRFFQQQEDLAKEIFVASGGTMERWRDIEALRQEHNPHKTYPARISSETITKEADKIHKTARRLEDELSGAQRELGSVKSALVETQINYVNLNNSHSDLERQHAELSDIHNVQFARLVLLEQDLERKNRDLANAQAQLTRLELNNNKLSDDLSRQIARNERLKASMSWRITAPIRGLGRMAKKIKGEKT